MTAWNDREGTSEAAYEALKAEVMRAATRLSCVQVMDLADALHCVLRLRRPGRPVHCDGWRDAEAHSFSEGLRSDPRLVGSRGSGGEA